MFRVCGHATCWCTVHCFEQIHTGTGAQLQEALLHVREQFALHVRIRVCMRGALNRVHHRVNAAASADVGLN